VTFARSTTSTRTYEKKNARGASFKTVAPAGASNGGADKETKKASKRMSPGAPGIGMPKGPGPSPFAERNMKKASYKTVAPRAEREGGEPNAKQRGKRLDQWARGKRATP
jgi:hypothetical protein